MSDMLQDVVDVSASEMREIMIIGLPVVSKPDVMF